MQPANVRSFVTIPPPPDHVCASPLRPTPIHGCARRDPLIEMHWLFGPVRRCQATSWDRSTRVYSGLRHVSSITPSMKSLPEPLDLEDEEWRWDACAPEASASGRPRQQQSVRTLLQCLATVEGELVCAPAFRTNQCISPPIGWGVEINIVLLQHDGGSSVVTNCGPVHNYNNMFLFGFGWMRSCDPWRISDCVFLVN